MMNSPILCTESIYIIRIVRGQYQTNCVWMEFTVVIPDPGVSVIGFIFWEIRAIQSFMGIDPFHATNPHVISVRKYVLVGVWCISVIPEAFHALDVA